MKIHILLGTIQIISTVGISKKMSSYKGISSMVEIICSGKRHQ